MEPLTKRQKEVLDFISQFIENHGYAPSFREIGEHFNFSSTGTIAEYVNILEYKGYLSKASLCARSLQLSTRATENHLEVQLLGTIAAGAPIEAIRTNETIDVPKDMLGRQTFALKVRGNSMIDDGIFDGDYVIIEQTHLAHNGDIVVALIDNENVTLKRFYNEKSQIRLQPANNRLKPIRLAKKRVTIQGKVKGVIRKFK